MAKNLALLLLAATGTRHS